jgi:hypothetical protein
MKADSAIVGHFLAVTDQLHGTVSTCRSSLRG